MEEIPSAGVPYFFISGLSCSDKHAFLMAQNQEVGILNPMTTVRLTGRKADKENMHLVRCHIIRGQEGHM